MYDSYDSSVAKQGITWLLCLILILVFAAFLYAEYYSATQIAVSNKHSAGVDEFYPKTLSDSRIVRSEQFKQLSPILPISAQQLEKIVNVENANNNKIFDDRLRDINKIIASSDSVIPTHTNHPINNNQSFPNTIKPTSIVFDDTFKRMQHIRQYLNDNGVSQ